MISITDNFNSDLYSKPRYITDTLSIREKKLIGDKKGLSLDGYLKQSSQNTFFSFHDDTGKKISKNTDEFIVSISKGVNGDYSAQSGNYVGKFSWGGIVVDIRSRFSGVFLKRMLNYANDVFLDDVSVFGKESIDLDFSKLIIYYMFIQKLEKAFLLGIPKAYRSVRHHDMKLKGRVDINRFIKKDIPFKGKLSSVSREQTELQEVLDILYKAIQIIDKQGVKSRVNLTQNISHIKTHLKQNRSNKYVSNETIRTALNSKALQNPIFAPYKTVLKYAKLIIDANNLEESSNGDGETYGFLVNVAELFEIYVTKLLQKEFADWHVSSPKEELYPNQFYQRKIIPDIVMRKDNRIIVFDTKYKRMLMRGTKENVWDVDRNDFFQINTYMSYYQNHREEYNLIAGGLLYPMEKEFNHSLCHSDSWFGNNEVSFIVDGIGDLSKLNLKAEDIVAFESAFIGRLRNIISKHDSRELQLIVQ